MDTRGRSGDEGALKRTAEVTTDTGSVQIVELGTIGPPPRSRRATALLIAGLAVGAALVGLLVLGRPALAPAASASPSGPLVLAPRPTPSATGAPIPTPRATTTPRPTRGPWVWDAYDVKGFGPTTEARRIWGFGNRFVTLVVTRSLGVGGTDVQSLLVSTDGSTWARAVLPSPAFQVAQGIVVDQALWLIGVGYADGTAAREMWVTLDGSTWTRAASSEPMLVGVDEVLAIAPGPAGWVALCSTTREPDAAPVIEVRRELADGGWELVDLPLDMHERARGMVGDGTDLVLLVEHISDESDGWFDLLQSSDGEVWSLVKALRPGAEITDMVAGARGFIVAGEQAGDDGARPIAWQSDHGEVWHEATMPAGELAPELSPVGVHRVVVTSEGYLAISEANGMAWSSPDGLTWKAWNVWPSANNFMVDVATVGDTVVGPRGNPGVLGFLHGRVSGLR